MDIKSIDKIEQFITKIPKVELHLHLEGAIPHDALWELVQKYGGESSVPNLQALIGKFQYRDFPHFIETWVWKNQFLREYEDFTLIAEAVARDLANQNILYAETIFAPSDFARHGLETQKLANAIRTGLSKVPEVEIALIADLVRDRGLENAAKNLAEVNEMKSLGIIGITIGGSEQDYPPEPFADIYERARQLGFHTSAHAGEASGPKSIWGAINSLEVERVGPGMRANEDPRLVSLLKETQIPLEMCVTSNVKTGVCKSVKHHPIRAYFKEGLMVTVNSDDPAMFNTSITHEFLLLFRELGFSIGDLKRLSMNGIDASFMSDSDKKAMKSQFEREWKQLLNKYTIKQMTL